MKKHNENKTQQRLLVSAAVLTVIAIALMIIYLCASPLRKSTPNAQITTDSITAKNDANADSTAVSANSTTVSENLLDDNTLVSANNTLSQNEIAAPVNEASAEPEAVTSPQPDRVNYADGFYYESLSDAVKERINGKSYKDNCSIPYEDLRYLSVLYCDFNGQTQTGEIICNKSIAQDLIEIFCELYKNEYQIDKIRLVDEYDADDDLSCADNNSSCFNFRTVEGSNNLSNHAKGVAIDINPFQNPYVTYPGGKERISPAGSEPYADRNSGLAHMIDENDLCYKLFTAHGFRWGGHWKSLKDYQHFDKKQRNTKAPWIPRGFLSLYYTNSSNTSKAPSPLR